MSYFDIGPINSGPDSCNSTCLKVKKSKHSLSHRDKDYHFPITYENHTKCSILKYRIVWYDTISYHILGYNIVSCNVYNFISNNTLQYCIMI